MTVTTVQFARLHIGPRLKYVSPVWHRVEGEQTACGIQLSGREVPGTPPPGATKCRSCERDWQVA